MAIRQLPTVANPITTSLSQAPAAVPAVAPAAVPAVVPAVAPAVVSTPTNRAGGFDITKYQQLPEFAGWTPGQIRSHLVRQQQANARARTVSAAKPTVVTPVTTTRPVVTTPVAPVAPAVRPAVATPVAPVVRSVAAAAPTLVARPVTSQVAPAATTPAVTPTVRKTPTAPVAPAPVSDSERFAQGLQNKLNPLR